MARYKSDGSRLWRDMRGRLVKSQHSLLMAGIVFLALLGAMLSLVLGVPRPAAQGGCRNTLPDGMTTGREYVMSYPGGGRDWILFIPHSYSPSQPNPVVLSFHGGGRTPERQRDLDLLEAAEYNQEYVVVYPRGLEGRWEGTPNITPRDDVGYTLDILDELTARLCIDERRVFMTGKSNGGGFVGLAACDRRLTARVAAFAAVSGSFYIPGKAGCDPATVPLACDKGAGPVPMLEIHGGSDGTIRYQGDRDRRGSCLPDVRHWVEAWAARDGVSEQEMPPGRTEWSGDAEVRRWGPVTDGGFGLVTHVYDAGLGHSWPSTSGNADNAPRPGGNGDGPASFDATPAILQFFRGHELGARGSE